jgi:hypothetical protein
MESKIDVVGEVRRNESHRPPLFSVYHRSTNHRPGLTQFNFLKLKELHPPLEQLAPRRPGLLVFGLISCRGGGCRRRAAARRRPSS